MTDKTSIVVIVGGIGRSKRSRTEVGRPRKLSHPWVSVARAWKAVAPVAVAVFLRCYLSPLACPTMPSASFQFLLVWSSGLWRAECGDGSVHTGAPGGALWELM
jgi:hypothetical protein